MVFQNISSYSSRLGAETYVLKFLTNKVLAIILSCRYVYYIMQLFLQKIPSTGSFVCVLEYYGNVIHLIRV